VPIKVPIQPVGVPCLQIALGFGTAVGDPACGGSLSVFPLFGLFADFSQIDDVAHLSPVTDLSAGGTLAAQTAHLTQSPSPLPAVNRIHLFI